MFKNKCPATQSNETAECAKDVNRPSLVLLVSRFVGAHPGNIRDSLKLLPPAPDITLAHMNSCKAETPVRTHTTLSWQQKKRQTG